MAELLPTAWVQRVHGVIPDVGYHVRHHGLWLEPPLDSVPLSALLTGGSEPKLSPSQLLQVLEQRINKTQASAGEQGRPLLMCLTV